MLRAWASFLTVAVLYSCGGRTGGWLPVDSTARGGGLEISLIRVYVDDQTVPWRGPKPGTHCFVYELRAHSTDGRCTTSDPTSSRPVTPPLSTRWGIAGRHTLSRHGSERHPAPSTSPSWNEASRLRGSSGVPRERPSVTGWAGIRTTGRRPHFLRMPGWV